MRSLTKATTLLGLAAAVGLAASPALSQMMGRRGNQDQQQTGYVKPPTKEEKRFPLGSSWVVVSLNGKAYAGRERPSFAMDDQFRVRGFGGCNSFSATAFPLREQGIAVGPLAMTKRSCDKPLMDSEQVFLTALRTSAKWDTVVGSLVIKGPNGELKLERAL